MAFSLPFSPLVSILLYFLMQTTALAQGKTLLRSTGFNVIVKISSSGIITIMLISASEFIWGLKEVHLSGQNGYGDPPA